MRLCTGVFSRRLALCGGVHLDTFARAGTVVARVWSVRLSSASWLLACAGTGYRVRGYSEDEDEEMDHDSWDGDGEVASPQPSSAEPDFFDPYEVEVCDTYLVVLVGRVYIQRMQRGQECECGQARRRKAAQRTWVQPG